jgi:hypothetical protein
MLLLEGRTNKQTKDHTMEKTQENKLSHEKRQALEMIRNSKYFQGINRVTVLNAKLLNTNDIQEASKIIDQMVEAVLNS